MNSSIDGPEWELRFLVTSINGKRRVMHAKQIDSFERNFVTNRDYGLFIDQDTGKSVKEEVISIFPLYSY